MDSKTTKQTIQYNGSVNIKVLNGTKVVKTAKTHNSGTSWLFQVLASAIIGSNETNNMPKYLDVFENTGTTESVTLQSIISNPVPLTSKHMEKDSDTNDGWVASFTAIIPYRSIKSGGDHVIYCLRLYSTAGNETTQIAEVKPSDITINRDNRSNLAVEWRMLFSNPTISGGN